MWSTRVLRLQLERVHWFPQGSKNGRWLPRERLHLPINQRWARQQASSTARISWRRALKQECIHQWGHKALPRPPCAGVNRNWAPQSTSQGRMPIWRQLIWICNRARIRCSIDIMRLPSRSRITRRGSKKHWASIPLMKTTGSKTSSISRRSSLTKKMKWHSEGTTSRNSSCHRWWEISTSSVTCLAISLLALSPPKTSITSFTTRRLKRLR